MKTIDELKAAGFHGNNLVQVERPAFYFDESTEKIQYEPFYEGQEHFNLITRQVMMWNPTRADWYNAQDLIAWLPCSDADYHSDVLFFRHFVLKTADGLYRRIVRTGPSAREIVLSTDLI